MIGKELCQLHVRTLLFPILHSLPSISDVFTSPLHFLPLVLQRCWLVRVAIHGVHLTAVLLQQESIWWSIIDGAKPHTAASTLLCLNKRSAIFGHIDFYMIGLRNQWTFIALGSRESCRNGVNARLRTRSPPKLTWSLNHISFRSI